VLLCLKFKFNADEMLSSQFPNQASSTASDAAVRDTLTDHLTVFQLLKIRVGLHIFVCPVVGNLLDRLDNLHNILIVQHMVFADPHRLELGAGAPHHRVLQLVDDGPVDLVAEVLHSDLAAGQDYRLLIVGQLALRLRVDPDLGDEEIAYESNKSGWIFSLKVSLFCFFGE
jgi:hypothetical protein